MVLPLGQQARQARTDARKSHMKTRNNHQMSMQAHVFAATAECSSCYETRAVLPYWVDMVACKEGLGSCRGLLHMQTHPVLQKVDQSTNICTEQLTLP